jgi:hypothetical protein
LGVVQVLSIRITQHVECLLDPLEAGLGASSIWVVLQGSLVISALEVGLGGFLCVELEKLVEIQLDCVFVCHVALLILPTGSMCLLLLPSRKAWDSAGTD